MKKCSLIILVFLFSIIQKAEAQKVFDFNVGCVKAYHSAISLKLDPAQALLNQERLRNPNNLAVDFIENYIDFFVLFLNENPAERKKRINNWSKRLDLINEAPDGTPLKLLSKAIINLQWAVVEIKFGNRWAAGWAFRDAFKQAKENQQKFPNFSPNLMITGPMQMAAATIPKGQRWLSNLLGIKGTMEQGKAYISQFVNANDAWAKLFMEEGIFYMCYLQFYLLNQPDEAIAVIQNKKLDIVNNQLFTYMAANLCLNNKQSRRTMEIIKNRNASAEYITTGIWDFEMAFAKLFHLEPDAGGYFERFLANFKGTFYVKDMWLKLAMHYFLQKNIPQYNRCIKNAIEKGNTNTDADKRALREAKIGRTPNVILLKARLLNDGGYYNEALLILTSKTAEDFILPEEKLEYMYRSARIYDDLGRDDDALRAYQNTINFGKSRQEYFAARAALQAGMIYEKKGNKAMAIQYFQLCISLEDHDYKDSLDQKAKAGINRCGGKAN